MHVVTSKDGTKIAYEKQGEGPAVILVAGALCARLSWSGPHLSKLLAPHFRVYNYDRRGRGDSGDTKPYAVAREVEDIEALIDEAGGSACLYGHSSGAALVLEAAIQLGPPIKKLALHAAILGEDSSIPTQRIAVVTAPTLVINGGASFPFMNDTAQALSKAIPNAKLRTIEGQTHDVDVDLLAPVLGEFFAGSRQKG
ncbi:MAG: alpha/beta hydrolase [Chloroflexi bacterium]|nr:MAG: alpha/beta hydrolase [Chloroflexota bacterium]